jgi:hypothetical protein
MGSAPPEVEPGPPKMIEKAIGLLIPPACREEVLGDLQERCAGSRKYMGEAVRTVPLVVLSRIRRTTDPGLLLLEAMALYLAFVSSVVFFGDASFLLEPNAYLRLAVPVVLALEALVLADAYATAGKRTVAGLLAALCAILVESLAAAANPNWAVPLFLVIFGACTGLLLVAALRLLFAPGDNRTTGAG